MKASSLKVISFFRKRKGTRILWCYFVIALLAPFIACRSPLLVLLNGQLHFPAFSRAAYIALKPQETPQRINTIDWRSLPASVCILPPVCYDPDQIDPLNSNFASPFETQYERTASGKKVTLPWRYRHWLGTTRTGQDVLSLLIHGCRTSLLIGMGAVALSALIALFAGLIAGYYGDHNLRWRRSSFIAGLIAILPALFYTRQLVSLSDWRALNTATVACSLFILLLFLMKKMIAFPLNLFEKNQHRITIPADKILTAVTSGFIALPRLLLLLTLAAIWKPSILSLILIIGLTTWAEPARIIRTEILRLRSLSFIEQAKVSGAADWQIIIRHALPNLSSTIRVVFLTGVAAAILTEAGLTFLGIGLPFNTPSWGILLFEAKRNIQAWWLAVIPGAVLYLLTRTLFMLSKK